MHLSVFSCGRLAPKHVRGNSSPVVHRVQDSHDCPDNGRDVRAALSGAGTSPATIYGSQGKNPMNGNCVATPLTSADEERLRFTIQRARANLLCLWHLCIKSAYRRARTCSADPGICIGRLAPFVPEHVRSGVDALLGAKFGGLLNEQVCRPCAVPRLCKRGMAREDPGVTTGLRPNHAAKGKKSTARPLTS